jgi:spore germination protein (amino acid permease)
MEKIIITDHQLFTLTALYTCGSAIINTSADVTSLAKQDAWISALFTPIWGLLVVWIITFLGSRYPGMTFVEITQQILGKWFGWIISAGFVIFCLRCAPQIPWFIGNFITTQSMPETPEYAINIIFVTAIVIAILFGVESIARASEIFILFVSVLFLFSMLCVAPNAHMENIFPICENGITPILSGSFFLSGLLTFPIIILLMIYPRNVNDIHKAEKAIFKGYLWGAFLIFLSILMSILVIGNKITAQSQYPIYLLAKEINVGIIFSRLEFIVAAVWIVTLFIKGVLYFYAGILGFSQLIDLKEHKRIVIPFGLIMVVMSGIIFPNTDYQKNWDKYVLLPYEATYGLVLPALLLLVYTVKNKVLKLKVENG